MTAEAPSERRAPAGRRPPRPPRRGLRLRIAATALFLAAVGFLIWYFAFNSDDGGEEQPAVSSLALTPATIDFGDEDVRKRSAVQTLTLTNGGAQPAGIAAIELTGRHRRSFAITKATTCSAEAPLNETDTCTVAVRFQPKGRGERTATLVVRFVGGVEQLASRLRGTGLGEPEIVVETTRLEFGEVELGSGPVTESTTVRNRGNVPLRFESLDLEGPAAGNYRLVQRDNGCTPRRGLRPGQACTLTVRFTPGEVGERTATLVVRHDAAGSPTTLELAGIGLGRPQGRLSPGDVGFGQVRVNRRSDAKTVTLENSGSATLTVAGVSLDGEDPRDFRIAGGSCDEGTTLEPGATCTVELRFRPRTRGRHAATLVVEADTRARRHTADLRGTGIRRQG